MKARLLKKLLNNTGYAVHNCKDYIAVGSPMCHNLISVDKGTMKLKYALDTFHKGRAAIDHVELRFIWDKLQELIDNGQLKEIIAGNDDTAGMFPVWTAEDGAPVQKFTEKMEWPNVCHDGTLIYQNTFFKTKKGAILYAITEYEIAMKWRVERLEELSGELGKVCAQISGYRNQVEQLRLMLKEER